MMKGTLDEKDLPVQPYEKTLNEGLFAVDCRSWVPFVICVIFTFKDFHNRLRKHMVRFEHALQMRFNSSSLHRSLSVAANTFYHNGNSTGHY